MLSEKPWNRELLLLLIAGLLISWCLGMIAAILIEQFLPADALVQKSFYRFLVSTLAFHGATLLLVHQFLKLHGTTWPDFLGLTRPRLMQAILFALLVGILVLPVVMILNEWSARLLNSLGTKPVLQPTIKVLQTTVGSGQRICFGFAAILLAPVAEESLFRGILYPYIKQRGHRAVALFGTSVLFAAFHSNLATFLPLAFFAIILVLIYERTDKLLAPILTHALFNAVNFSFFIFERELNQLFHRLWTNWH
jgi:membrane protease YdiL (CAAX protease family)